jgi:hypothetical protein
MRRIAIMAGALCMMLGLGGAANGQVVSLLVGNQSGFPGLDRYDGTTGAFLGFFGNVPGLSSFSYFKYGGPNSNLFVQQFPNVLQFDGHTGAFINNFVTQSGGNFAFGPDNHMYRLEPFSQTQFFPAGIGKYDGATGNRLGTFVAANASGINTATGGLRFGPDGNLYVDTDGTILRFNGTTGASMGAFITPGSSPLVGFVDALFTNDGRLLGVGGGTGTIDKVFQYDATSGAYLGVFAAGNGLDAPIGLAQGPDGNIYVASTFADKIHRFNLSTGAFLGDFVPNTVHDAPTYIGFTPFPVPEPTSLMFASLGMGLFAVRRLCRNRTRQALRASGNRIQD